MSTYYFKITINESLNSVQHTRLTETGLNIFKTFVEKKSKDDPYSYYASSMTIGPNYNRICGTYKSFITIYKNGMKSSIKIKGWTFPAEYKGYDELHVNWHRKELYFDCITPSGKSKKVHVSGGRGGAIDRLITAFNLIIQFIDWEPSSIFIWNDKTMFE